MFSGLILTRKLMEPFRKLLKKNKPLKTSGNCRRNLSLPILWKNLQSCVWSAKNKFFSKCHTKLWVLSEYYYFDPIDWWKLIRKKFGNHIVNQLFAWFQEETLHLTSDMPWSSFKSVFEYKYGKWSRFYKLVTE